MLVKSVRQRDRDVFIFIYTYFLSINMPVIMVLSVVLGHFQQRESAHPHSYICVIEMEILASFPGHQFCFTYVICNSTVLPNIFS